ncbi:MAG: RNA methyltransferase [Cryomorphaceae bacterium]|nr:RNA methyltransferase [Cryomorphaceae bacterium]
MTNENDKGRRKLRTDEMQRLSTDEFKQATKITLHLVIDNLRSMHNVGSVFRSADAFRVSHIHLCGHTPVPPHKGIHKTALGATESVDWSYHKNTLDVISQLKNNGVKVYCLEQTQNSIALETFCEELKHGESVALVLGNEVSGVDQDVIDASDGAVEIPQYGTKHSLNVAVSAGIAIWAIALQLKKAP